MSIEGVIAALVQVSKYGDHPLQLEFLLLAIHMCVEFCKNKYKDMEVDTQTIVALQQQTVRTVL